MGSSMQLNRTRVQRAALAAWPLAADAVVTPRPPDARLTPDTPPATLPLGTDAATVFSALIVEYDRLIRAIVARLGRRFGLRRDSFTVQDDIAQEVRLDLWKQVARGQTIEFPASYIYTATIRETVRALKRMMSREMDSIDEDGPASHAADGADPFKLLAAKDQFKAILACIAALAPDRQAAVRAHLSGFEFQEVMVMHGWTYQKVRNLVARGMADLRSSLGGERRPRRHKTDDPRMAALHAQIEALRAGVHALNEHRQSTVRLEHTAVRK
jgi:DNA-directed RNA polymerase specialized sigma24 family protein